MFSSRSGRPVPIRCPRHWSDQCWSRRSKLSRTQWSGSRIQPSGSLPLIISRSKRFKHWRERLSKPDTHPQVAVSGPVVPWVVGIGRQPWGDLQQWPGWKLQLVILAASTHCSKDSAGSVWATLEIDHLGHRFDSRLLHKSGACQRLVHGHSTEVEAGWVELVNVFFNPFKFPTYPLLLQNFSKKFYVFKTSSPYETLEWFS